MTSPDLVVEAYFDDWIAITDDVRYGTGESLTIVRGAQSEDGQTPPGRAALKLHNETGKYSSRNPMGPHYGKLRNTGLRVAVRQDSDEFGRTVASGWGSTDTGNAWAAAGSGGTVQASDFNVAAGVGTHSVPAVSASRFTYLAGVVCRDVDIAVTFQLAFSDVTGGDLEPANIIVRGLSISDYLLVRVVVSSTETVTVKLMHRDGTTYAAAVTVPGLVHTGQRIRVRGQIEGQTFRAKVWEEAGAEPFGWHVTGRVTSTPRKGFIGVRSGVAGANTNASPVVFSYDNWEVRRPRGAFEVPEWSPRFDVAVSDLRVPIVAQGILRRLEQGALPVQSALRRSIPTAPGLVAYWPLEDGENSTQFASALPGVAPMDINGPVDLASFDDFKASAPLPQANLGRWTGRPPDHPATGVIQLRFLLAVPSGGASDGAVLARITTTGTALLWELSYATGGGLRLRAFNSVGTELLNSVTGFSLNGALVRVSLELWHSGANTNWMVSTLAVGSSVGGFVTNTVNSVSVGRALVIEFSPFAGFDDVAIGHISLQNVQTSLFDLAAELAAFNGETAGNRIVRLCGEQGVPIAMWGDPDDTAAMGPQSVTTLLDLLDECQQADLGTLYESRGELGLAYRTRVSKYNQAATATIDYAAQQLAPPFDPVDDDRGLANDVTVSRINGSSARVVQEDGPMSVQDPADGGAGRYAPPTRQLSLYSDLQLRDIAAWLKHLGTVDETRYPVIAVNLQSDHVIGTALASDILDLDVDDVLALTDTAELMIYDDVRQLARGYTEVIAYNEHKIDTNCVPASPWEVIELDDGESRAHSSSSTLDIAVTDVATTLSVKSTAERWTTDAGQMPIPIVIGGEKMSVTAIGSSVPTFVAAGAAAHADNASVVPGLPAGLQAGDLLLVLAAARNAGAGTPNTPDGYAELGAVDNLKLFAKYAEAGEAAPTVSFTGTVSGATCSAQAAAFRGVSIARAAATGGTNASAQDIAFPLLDLPFGPSLLVLHAGWKQDDWTSVAALSGASEIGEPSSTLGNDQGLVWDYRTVTDAKGAIDAGSFAVTGGAAAVSCSMVVAFYATQAFTVTRSVNGVTKAHAAGDTVQVDARATVAL